jgi:hypothetical protein
VNIADGPTCVIWDMTYACPLRCVHCYSESGRRATRQLSHEDMLRLADAICSIRPQVVLLSGGEPFAVKGVFDVAGRISRAGIQVDVYTSGWFLEPRMIERIPGSFNQVTVSLDGATPDVHDRIRGRSGSFDRAMNALAMLDGAAREQRTSGAGRLDFGIDCVMIRSNFHQMGEFCTSIAPRFPELGHLLFGAAVPSGLANRTGFAADELLSDDQIRVLGDAEHLWRLRSLSPPSVRVDTTDNRALQMRPDLIAQGMFFPAMQIEPDGEVRAMPIYEGSVGNILTRSPAELWQKAVARWSDPFVVETLSPVRTMKEWAAAARRIDNRFGSSEVLARIDRRPRYQEPAH